MNKRTTKHKNTEWIGYVGDEYLAIKYYRMYYTNSIKYKLVKSTVWAHRWQEHTIAKKYITNMLKECKRRKTMANNNIRSLKKSLEKESKKSLCTKYEKNLRQWIRVRSKMIDQIKLLSNLKIAQINTAIIETKEWEIIK